MIIGNESLVRARKEPSCTACNIILSAYGLEGYELNEGLKEFLSDDEIKEFHNHAKTHKSKIQPGQIYRKYTCLQEGVFYHNRELLVCYRIIEHYELWDPWQ
jgi:hypothetical protein